MSDKSDNLNKFSKRIADLKSQGASQGMLYGTGMNEAKMKNAEAEIPLLISGYPFIKYRYKHP